MSSILPDSFSLQESVSLESEEEIMPSKTYGIDFQEGRMRGVIDGKEAIQQFIYNTIRTPRYKHFIYPDYFGCEIHDVIGKDYSEPLMRTEIERTIKEALIYDERIENVSDFVITVQDDEINVQFTVDTIEGLITIKEAFKNV
jgi:phage baseplate assembly protein W